MEQELDDNQTDDISESGKKLLDNQSEEKSELEQELGIIKTNK